MSPTAAHYAQEPRGVDSSADLERWWPLVWLPLSGKNPKKKRKKKSNPCSASSLSDRVRSWKLNGNHVSTQLTHFRCLFIMCSTSWYPVVTFWRVYGCQTRGKVNLYRKSYINHLIYRLLILVWSLPDPKMARWYPKSRYYGKKNFGNELFISRHDSNLIFTS